MRRRDVLLAFGAIAVLCGVVFTLRPGLVRFDAATALTLGIWVVALVGVAVAALDRADGRGDDAGALPRAGERPAYDAPGDDIAAAVDAAGAGERDAAERDRIRRRLRTSAVAALVRFAGVSPDAAERRVSDGSWTDDAEAAALFADDRDERVHEGVEPNFDGRARRAAGAIARLRERGATARDGDRSSVAGGPSPHGGEPDD